MCIPLQSYLSLLALQRVRHMARHGLCPLNLRLGKCMRMVVVDHELAQQPFLVNQGDKGYRMNSFIKIDLPQ
jgi:hypothetical protein